jgi:hypothetical protein
MRIYSKVVVDIDSGQVIESVLWDADYRGPVALAKGDAAKAGALANMNTAAGNANTLFSQGEAEQAQLLPFLQQEMSNPQGFGQPTLNAMTTAAGQGASGAVSDATNQAKLRAARTGNLAGQSAIIGSAARSGANAQTNANLKTQIANAQEKLKQQQLGASGMESLGGTDLKDALASLGLSNEAVNAWSGANKSAGNLWSNVFGPLITAGEGAAGSVFAGKG